LELLKKASRELKQTCGKLLLFISYVTMKTTKPIFIPYLGIFGGVERKVHLIVTYLVSLIVIVISVFVTLFVKEELERLFRQTKAAVAFHICNVIITFMFSLVAHTVMTVYILGHEFKLLLSGLNLLLMILPIYFIGHLAFEKYKTVYRKFTPVANGKVIVLNERYLKKKKRFKKLDNYNSISKEK
jgi:uncharacterized protein YacL